MIIRNIIFTIIAISSIAVMQSSCNDIHKSKEFNKLAVPITNNVTSEYTVIITDTIKMAVPFDQYNSFHELYILNDTLVFGKHVDKRFSLSVFNLNSRQYIKTIDLDNNLFNTADIASISIASPDSIFFLATPKPQIYLINFDGEELRNWDNTDMEIPLVLDKENSLSNYGFSDAMKLHNGPYYDKKEGLLYISICPIGNVDFEGRPDIMRHGVYSLISNKWINFFGDYSGILKYKGDGHYYFDMHYSYQLIRDDIIILSHPVDHQVHIFDKADFSLKMSKFVTPTNASKVQSPIPGGKSNDKLLNEMRRSTLYYGPVYYHRNLDLFSRFYNHPNREFLRTLIIFDRGFNVVGEKTYNIDNILWILPTSYGYIFSPASSTLQQSDTAIFISAVISKLKQ